MISAKQSVHSGNLESALSSLVIKESEGAKILSRAQWLEDGEKATRYFFRLEQKRAAKNFFKCLLDENGPEKSFLTDLEAILVNFYTSLFSKEALNLQVQSALINDFEFSLSDHKRALCECLFTADELFNSLKSIQTGKSPGSDGLTPTFYLAFWDLLGIPYCLF